MLVPTGFTHYTTVSYIPESQEEAMKKYLVKNHPTHGKSTFLSDTSILLSTKTAMEALKHALSIVSSEVIFMMSESILCYVEADIESRGVIFKKASDRQEIVDLLLAARKHIKTEGLIDHAQHWEDDVLTIIGKFKSFIK